MTNRLAVLVALILALPARSFATPISVNLLNSSYTLTLSGTVTDNTTGPTPVTESATRVLSSLLPVSDSLRLNSASGTAALAEGTAGLFSTTTHTNSGNRLADHSFSQADVGATFDFAPVSDSTGEIGIDFLGRFQSEFSSGFISLFDLTVNDNLWDYSWDHFQPTDTLPWVRENGTVTASFFADSFLLASHTYRLQMFTSTNSNKDEQLITVGVTGLQTVPEPASLTLIVAAAASGVLGRRLQLRRRK